MSLKGELYSELWEDDLLAYEDCTLDECRKFYERVRNKEPLPPDVWQVGSAYRFIRLKENPLTPEEFSQLIQLRQLKTLKSIRAMVLFFVVLAVAGLLLGVLGILFGMWY